MATDKLSDEQKKRAVDLVLNKEVSQADVARRMNVSRRTINILVMEARKVQNAV